MFIFGILQILAILLGHMRMSVSEIKTALTRMDETLLTNELLKQMIAYAPDAKEVSTIVLQSINALI